MDHNPIMGGNILAIRHREGSSTAPNSTCPVKVAILPSLWSLTAIELFCASLHVGSHWSLMRCMFCG